MVWILKFRHQHHHNNNHCGFLFKNCRTLACRRTFRLLSSTTHHILTQPSNPTKLVSTWISLFFLLLYDSIWFAFFVVWLLDWARECVCLSLCARQLECFRHTHTYTCENWETAIVFEMIWKQNLKSNKLHVWLLIKRAVAKELIVNKACSESNE